MSFLLGWPILRCKLLVSGSVYIRYLPNHPADPVGITRLRYKICDQGMTSTMVVATEMQVTIEVAMVFSFRIYKCYKMYSVVDVNAILYTVILYTVLWSHMSRIVVVLLLMYGFYKRLCLPRQGLQKGVCVWMEILWISCLNLMKVLQRFFFALVLSIVTETFWHSSTRTTE